MNCEPSTERRIYIDCRDENHKQCKLGHNSKYETQIAWSHPGDLLLIFTDVLTGIACASHPKSPFHQCRCVVLYSARNSNKELMLVVIYRRHYLHCAKLVSAHVEAKSLFRVFLSKNLLNSHSNYIMKRNQTIESSKKLYHARLNPVGSKKIAHKKFSWKIISVTWKLTTKYNMLSIQCLLTRFRY